MGGGGGGGGEGGERRVGVKVEDEVGGAADGSAE